MIREMVISINWRLYRSCLHRAIMLFCMMLFLLSGAHLSAENSPKKVVKVACAAFDRLMILGEDGNPISGYAYEYIQTVGVYAGWNVEYVPCSNFSNSLQKLISGEVDLAYDISYTEERAQKILFPDEPMGTEYYFLYASAGNKLIAPGDYAAMNGKTIGITSGTMMIDILNEWCKKNNVKINIREYKNIPDKEAALYAGKIDLDLEISMLAKHNLSAIEKIGSSTYYLAANKERPDLIDDMNSALDRILTNDLNYFTHIQDQYFSETTLSRNLTVEEKDWLAKHKVLRVGFLDNYLPFSTKDKNGEPIGAGIDAIREIFRKLNLDDQLKLEFICYNDQMEGYKAVESGKVDLMFPAYISSSVKQDYHIIGGKVLSTLTSDIAYLKEFGDGKGKRIGVNRNNLMQYYYCKDCYPSSEIVYYDNIRACLDGLLNGTSDGTFLNSFRTEALLKPVKYHSIRAERAKTFFKFRMAFAENNIGLMLLMDRGLTMLDHDFISGASYSFVGRMNFHTMMDHLQNHILLVLLAVAVLVAVVISLIWYQVSLRKQEENAKRFLLTLRSIGDGIITTDAQGIVTLINPNAEKLLGCKQADVLGKPHTDFFRIVHEQTGKTVPSPLTEALQSGEIANGADLTDLISVSGQRYHIASNAAPILARSGEITGAILVFRDVTDERNKREELRRTMTNLENASSMARLAWFRYEVRTHRRFGPSLLYSIWPEDENGVPIRFEEWVHPDDIQIFARDLEEMEHSRKPGETATFSFRIGKAPNLRYIRALTTLDLSNPDEPAVTGILQDVTELTLNMLKLKDTQALWDAVINSIPIMFTVKDIDDEFRYLLCNKAFAKNFNLSPDNIIGKTDRDIFHDDAILSFTKKINIPATETDGIMEIEGELPDGRGNLRYTKTLMRVFEDVRGHHLLLAASNDVTDMHKLLQNRGVINKLLEDIIGEDDLNQCIQRTLETVCKILGASRGCLMRHEEEGTKAHCVFEYVDPTHAHASFRMLNRTLPRVRGVLEDTEDKRTFICNDINSIDWEIVKGDWRQTALALDLRAIFLSNIVIEGDVKGTVGFNFEGINHTFSDNDISLLRVTSHMLEVILAKKHAQTLIMDALAQAQAADKAKSFFIASVSHEIRTPLNSVLGFAELLREGGVSKHQELEYLNAISTSANALLMLINDVLDLSKLEANQMKIITAFTDFNALCHEIMLIFSFRAQENGNKLVSDVPEDLPELDIDNIRIRQILINLFGNAVKFTRNGTITLHVSFTPDPDSSGTGTLRCAVTDTGIGISEEDQKKLMEPFVQLSGLRGTNAVNNGTGLGLSISKRLAVCMNGDLTCTSRMGEGSTFAVTLNSVRYHAKAVPAVKEQPKSKPVADAIARDVKQIRILVVDDVQLNLRVATALFNRIGFNNISTANSGKAALELLDKQPIDLILSDMWMPEMNGAEFSAEVKKNPRFAHIPIVAQTADVETNGNFDMSYFDAIILKPLSKEKLSNMIKRIIEDGNLQKDDDGVPVTLG